MFREEGARVRYNAFLRDTNVGVPADDGRRIEVWLKTSRRCPIGCGRHIAERPDLGTPHSQAADMDGAVLMAARREKESTYLELAASGRCKLVVVGTEMGGRKNESS